MDCGKCRIGGRMKRIGYWYSEYEPHYPKPQLVVNARMWSAEFRAKVAAYLDAGHVHTAWRGPSSCRFGCQGGFNMGTRCLTDGTYMWPQGLSHYVREHDVVLPTVVVNGWEKAGWVVPPKPEGDFPAGDDTFWLDITQHLDDPF